MIRRTIPATLFVDRTKHFALEAVRINNDKVSKVKSLLNKIYSQDEKIGNISTNSLKQFVMKREKQTGGAEGDPVPGEGDPPVGVEAGGAGAVTAEALTPGAPEAGAAATGTEPVAGAAPEAGAVGVVSKLQPEQSSVLPSLVQIVRMDPLSPDLLRIGIVFFVDSEKIVHPIVPL